MAERIPDHLLHATMSSEAFWTYRLECLSAGFHESWTEKRGGCDCTCESCTAEDSDHGGCDAYGGHYIEEVGYECQAERMPGCWTQDWLDNYGDECIHGDDWPEDGLPFLVRCSYDDGLVIHYAGGADQQVSPGSSTDTTEGNDG